MGGWLERAAFWLVRTAPSFSPPEFSSSPARCVRLPARVDGHKNRNLAHFAPSLLAIEVYPMRSQSSLHALIVAAGIVTLVGCSGGMHSGMVPAPTSPRAHSFPERFEPGLIDVAGVFRSAVIGSSHLKSFDACPASGPIKYVGDQNNDAIYLYTGNSLANHRAPISSVRTPESVREEFHPTCT